VSLFEVMDRIIINNMTDEAKVSGLIHAHERIEEISRLNTHLTLQNERIEEKVLMLLDDIDVLNSVIKEQVI